MSDPALQPKPGLRESVTDIEERLAAVEGELRTVDGRALRERVADAEERLGTEHTAAGLNAMRKRVGVTEERLDEHRDILDGHAARLTALETVSDEQASQDEETVRALRAKLPGQLERGEVAEPDRVVDAEVHCACCEQAQRDAHAAMADWRRTENALDDMTRQRDDSREWVEHWRDEAGRHETGRIEAEDRSIAADEARDRMLHARDEAIRQRDRLRTERDEWKIKYGANSPTAVAYEQACASLDEQKERADDAETDSVRECARADDAERELEEASRELRTVRSINETLESQLNEARDERDRLAAGDADGAGEAITSRYRITRREANDEH